MFVADVLDQLAEGMAWEEISRQWNGKVTSKAISETILLAKNAFFHNGSAIRTSTIKQQNPHPALSRRTGRGNRAMGEAPVPRGKR